jgi:hypothetical protein
LYAVIVISAIHFLAKKSIYSHTGYACSRRATVLNSSRSKETKPNSDSFARRNKRIESMQHASLDNGGRQGKQLNVQPAHWTPCETTDPVDCRWWAHDRERRCTTNSGSLQDARRPDRLLHKPQAARNRGEENLNVLQQLARTITATPTSR